MRIGVFDSGLGGLTVLDSLINDVNKIKEDAENGLFNGEKGETGASAYDIYLSTGGTLTENEWLESLRGEPGKDGKTPVLGVDYWTESDKTEVKNYCNVYINSQLGTINEQLASLTEVE